MHTQGIFGAAGPHLDALVQTERYAIVCSEQIRGPIALALLAGTFASAALVEQARDGGGIAYGTQMRRQKVGQRHVRRDQVHRHDEGVLVQLTRGGEPVEQLRGAPARALDHLRGLAQAAHGLAGLGAVRHELNVHHRRRRHGLNEAAHADRHRACRAAHRHTHVAFRGRRRRDSCRLCRACLDLARTARRYQVQRA